MSKRRIHGEHEEAEAESGHKIKYSAMEISNHGNTKKMCSFRGSNPRE